MVRWTSAHLCWVVGAVGYGCCSDGEPTPPWQLVPDTAGPATDVAAAGDLGDVPLAPDASGPESDHGSVIAVDSKDPAGLPASCKESPGPSGVYTIAPPGQAPFQAYCEGDYDGGGWTRVAWVRGPTPMCAYTGQGDPQALLDGGDSTSVMPIEVSRAIPFHGEVMVAGGFPGTTAIWVFRSKAPGFTWEAVARGEIHNQNIIDYTVEGRKYADEFQPLVLQTEEQVNPPMLLGGRIKGTVIDSVVLGIGSYITGTFTQDEVCKKKAVGFPGLFSGTILAGPTWKMSAGVYIR